MFAVLIEGELVLQNSTSSALCRKLAEWSIDYAAADIFQGRIESAYAHAETGSVFSIVEPSKVALVITPGRSRRLVLLTIGCSVLAGLAILLADMPFLVRGVLLCALFVYTLLVWHQQPALGGARVSVVCDRENRWWLRLGEGERELALHRESLCSVGLVILRLVDVESHRSLVLCLLSDNTDAEVLRRLRIRLRQHRHPQVRRLRS